MCIRWEDSVKQESSEEAYSLTSSKHYSKQSVRSGLCRIGRCSRSRESVELVCSESGNESVGDLLLSESVGHLVRRLAARVPLLHTPSTPDTHAQTHTIYSPRQKNCTPPPPPLDPSEDTCFLV